MTRLLPEGRAGEQASQTTHDFIDESNRNCQTPRRKSLEPDDETGRRQRHRKVEEGGVHSTQN